MAETILITGATGLVGKTLTKVLLDQGYEINVLTTQKRLLGSNNDIHYFFGIHNPMKLIQNVLIK